MRKAQRGEYKGETRDEGEKKEINVTKKKCCRDERNGNYGSDREGL